jgi:hypothetical protein
MITTFNGNLIDIMSESKYLLGLYKETIKIIEIKFLAL